MFKLYVLSLALSGVLMLVLGTVKSGQRSGPRLFSVICGAGFLGYAFYLEFVFRGGHYFVFFYVFALPLLVLWRFFRARAAAAR